MKKVILFIISAMIWTSCVENSAEYKKLKSENEMLKAEKAQSTTELNEMLSTLNDIRKLFGHRAVGRRDESEQKRADQAKYASDCRDTEEQ